MQQCSAFSDILRVLPFTYDVEAWFLHLEAVWAGADLQDLQRYHAVVRALPSEVVARLYSVLSNLSEADRYGALKSAITGAFGRSREACFAALDSAQYDGGRPSALLARLSALNRAAGFPWSEALSLEEFSALVDRVHEAHVVLPPQHTPAPACLCPVNAAAPTDQPPAPAESLSLHVFQQQAAVTSGARRNPPLAAVPSSTETRLASVEASLRRLEALLAHSPTQTDAGTFRGGGTHLPTAMCLAPPGKRGGLGPLTPLPAPASLPRLCLDPLPRHPISALSPPAVQPAPGPTEPAPPPPLAQQCSMGGHDAPASPGRPTVAHTASPPAKQRSRDGRAPSPPPSRLQPTGGRATAPPTHLRVSAGHAPSQPSVGARHPYWPPAPPQPAEGFASVPPPGPCQPTPSSSDSPAPSPPPQHPEWFPASQRLLLWVRDICSGARLLVDSGEKVSVVPAADTDRRAQPRTAYDLLAANRTPIVTPQAARARNGD
ncbi:hypothetical protein E2C01_020372 [Portunus trituberculatus]|uniref:DUF7041 domain-containing protein n=1 Tax=Portunus trituberculatus TaxID=210409 RepID=A0A5B7E146_PORTR|nr:hypothetical protein [Portunus trituberculatus]